MALDEPLGIEIIILCHRCTRCFAQSNEAGNEAAPELMQSRLLLQSNFGLNHTADSGPVSAVLEDTLCYVFQPPSLEYRGCCFVFSERLAFTSCFLFSLVTLCRRCSYVCTNHQRGQFVSAGA